MFLNMSQSVITRQSAIKQYSKQLHDIKEQWQLFKLAQKRFFKDSRGSSSESKPSEQHANIKDLCASMKKLKISKRNKEEFDESNYLTNEEYNCLYTAFFHKLSTMRYHNDDDALVDYNDYQCCYRIMDTICDKFYSQTVEYLQHSWKFCIFSFVFFNFLPVIFGKKSVVYRWRLMIYCVQC